MKKSKPFEWRKATPLSKYLAMALFIALPFIAFVLGMKYQRAIEPKNSELPINENQSQALATFNVDTSTTVPVSNWKSFTSKEYKFSFKYPNDFVVSESKGKDTGIYIETPKLDSSLLVIYKIDLTNQTLASYIDNFWNQRKVSLKPYQVGQFQGQYVDNLNDVTRGRNIFFTNTNNDVFRMFYFVNQYVQPEYQPIINSIISTIKSLN